MDIQRRRTGLRALASLMIAFTAACASAPGAPAAPGNGTAPAGPANASGSAQVPRGTAEPLLYVTNQNDATVSIIDTRTNTVVRTVNLQTLGFSANAKPHHVQVEPDGSFWYVTLIGENRIVKLDRNDRVVGSATFETPGMLSLEADGEMMYVGRSMSAVNPPQRIGVVRRSDMSIEEVEVLFPRPHAMALEPESGTVYTASLGVNRIAAMDVATQRVQVTNVDGPQHALMQFAVSPDGRTMIVSGEISAKALVFDIATDRLRPRLLKEIPVGRQPFDPIYTPDGRWVYMGNKADNTVNVIDTRDWTVAHIIRGAGLAQPHGIAVSPDGRYVYVSNNNLTETHVMTPGMDHADHAAAPATPAGNGTIVVIDTQTHAIVKVIEVGKNAAGIAMATSH